MDLRDTPGTDVQDESAHGSGFDRTRAFRAGVIELAQCCLSYQA